MAVALHEEDYATAGAAARPGPPAAACSRGAA